mmetsp:Transcript_25805/g.60500  ORF Transcript_25805/g.60500 Transcript_25805/m.60500 type:complete len:304 (+) Transcript_25805:118-1029(+)
MVIQHFLPATKGEMTHSSNQIETHNQSTAGSKARRISASKFFKKGKKKEELSKDEIVKKLQDENDQLRKELNDANSRIRELESAAIENQTWEIAITPTRETGSVQSTTEASNARKSFEYRDDDVSGEEIDDDSDVFSIEVEAARPVTQHESFDHEDEVQSTSASASTIPTGNDKKSKLQRRQRESRQKVRRGSGSRSRGEDAYLNYFSRRIPPLESVTETAMGRSLLDSDSGDDTASTTSDLSMSIASSFFVEDETTETGSLMTGRKIPLRSMKSLLRSSSTSTESDTLPYLQDDEPVLFGEI